MELKIEHLAPYLPFELEFQRKGTGFTMIGIEHNYVKSLESPYDWFDFSEIKPYMRPLSYLTKKIEINGERFVPVEWLENKYYTLDLHKQCLKFLEEDGENWINQSDYMLIMHLFEWHFDVFNLIQTGIAIDVNTVK